MLPSETDILIVGAGPTGLALANTLQQAGVNHVLIDKLAAGQNTSRAAVVHAHTLEVLQSIGVSQQLADLGLKVSAFSIRDRDRALMTLNFGNIDSSHPYLLMLPQDVTEKVLADRLTSLGGGIKRGLQATNIVQSADGAQATVVTPDGERQISSRYVVGADGMHSIVRQAANIAFEGAAYEDSFVLADVHMDWPLRQQEVSLFFSPAGLVVVAPLPSGAYRVVATLDEAPEQPSAQDVQALIDARGPRHQRGKINDVLWSSRFRIHHRLAASYRKHRLFLMGDAAHVHSPAGGQGMNCGLVDACLLGQLFADVVHGRRADTALDDYERLRRPAAAEVLGLAGRLTGMATMRGTMKRIGRNIVLSTINRLSPAKHKLVQNLSGLARKHLAQLPAAAA